MLRNVVTNKGVSATLSIGTKDMEVLDHGRIHLRESQRVIGFERTPMADVLYGFDYFVWFGTAGSAVRLDNATMPRLFVCSKNLSC